MTIYVNLIKNLKLSNLNGIYDHYYLCFENGYEFIQQPLNELEFKGYIEIKNCDHSIYNAFFDKLNELIEKNDNTFFDKLNVYTKTNDFFKSCELQNNNIITLTCKKTHTDNAEDEDAFKFLVESLIQIKKQLI